MKPVGYRREGSYIAQSDLTRPPEYCRADLRLPERQKLSIDGHIVEYRMLGCEKYNPTERIRFYPDNGMALEVVMRRIDGETDTDMVIRAFRMSGTLLF